MLEFLPQMCSLYYMFLQIGEHLLIRPDFNGIQCFCVWKAMNFIVSMISLFFVEDQDSPVRNVWNRSQTPCCTILSRCGRSRLGCSQPRNINGDPEGFRFPPKSHRTPWLQTKSFKTAAVQALKGWGLQIGTLDCLCYLR